MSTKKSKLHKPLTYNGLKKTQKIQQVFAGLKLPSFIELF